jgi:hypothetical protein
LQTAPTSLLVRGTALAVLAAFSAACGGYTSDYVPPKDGRARVLFHGERAVASLPPADTGCLRAIQESPAELPPYLVGRGGGGGVTVVYWTPGLHVHASHARVRVQPAGAQRTLATPVARSVGGGSGPVGGGGVKSSGGGGGGVKSSGGSGTGFGLGKGSGGSSGKDLAVFAAVVVLLTLPVVALVMVASSPESGPDVADAMDRVNAYNDLARSPGSPCAPEVIIEQPIEGPEAPALSAPPPAPEAP